MEQIKNYGLILDPLNDKDYIHGFGNGIATDKLLDSGDWKRYLSRSEYQSGLYFDTMACVTFSALNCIEALINYKIQQKLITVDDVSWLNDQGYFNEEGKLNFSDRFIAKLSNTGKNGNTARNVADAIRKYGLVPEKDWPYPRQQRSPVFDWDDYYKTVPNSILNKGKKFLERFSINYEFVTTSFTDALKFSPLQVFVHAWNNPIDGVYKRTEQGINHAVSLVDHEEYLQIEDHYNPTLKKLSNDFNFYHYGVKYIIINQLPESMPKFYKVKDKSTIYQLGADNSYHPIAHADYFTKLFGPFDDNEIVTLDTISKEKVGSMVGEFNWFVQRVTNLFNK